MKDVHHHRIRINSILNFIEGVGHRSFFIAIRRGLAFSLPLIMVGAFVILLRDLPSQTLQQGLESWFGGRWHALCSDIVAGTFGMVSLAVLAGFSCAMAEMHNQRQNGASVVSPTIAIVVVTACWLITVAPTDAVSWRGSMSMDRGLLVALLVAALGSGLFLRLAAIRRLQLPLGVAGFDPMVRDILAVTPAAMLTILAFCSLRALMLLNGWTDIHNLLSQLLLTPFSGAHNTLGFALGYVSLSQGLWFLGVHGPNLLFAIEESMLVPASLANVGVAAVGGSPHFIFTKEFFDVFTRMGGSGSTLCLISALLLASRDRGIRRFALFALLPAACNVNEPLLFGLPLILNPLYLIPFLATPLLQTVTAYAATVLGLVPHTAFKVVWTTPVFFSGYAVTGSLSGVLLQLLNLALGTVLYIPFVRLSDTLRERRSRTLLRGLLRSAEALGTGVSGRKVLNLPGEEGRLAEALANDLERALLGSGQLFLEYQPQVDASGRRVHGVEALLRWNHPVYGLVAPPLTVAIAEDMGWVDALGLWVLSSACAQRTRWQQQVPADLMMSVNVSPQQLLDPLFDEKVLAILAVNQLDPGLLELEITESTILLPDARSSGSLHRLRQAGVRIALDDFGMGHTSLRYLRDLPIDTIKIDRSLTQGEADDVSEQIVRSIVDLSRSLGIDTIVEGVEVDAQLQRFVELGCDKFQGYLFSRPLAAEACLKFVASFG